MRRGLFFFARYSQTMNTSPLSDDVKEALRRQRRALDLLEEHLDETYQAAVSAILSAQQIVTSGVGKSSFVAQKFAASLTSLGATARFMHSTDALHGDLGAVKPGTLLVLFSKSGETRELIQLLDVIQRDHVRIVSITSQRISTISDRADISLLAPIEREFDRMNLLPSASTTTALVLADLLVMSVSHQMPDSVNVLTSTHPQGAIGSLLTQVVAQHMHTGASVPQIAPEATIEGAIHELDARALGIVCVVDERGALLGILTDGDVRRLVERGVDLSAGSVASVMTSKPTMISPTATLHKALHTMESRQRQIGVLPVVDANILVGVIRLHDVVRAQISVGADR
ncbi:MAG: KpsF/GutQ family sugar-phosphate isomerase [Candidatus Kapabacteria bacterium]|nr:KpsF/GutQ family sugar-phosphate isomerase [Candidatus Kapabacteria bacterium]